MQLKGRVSSRSRESVERKFFISSRDLSLIRWGEGEVGTYQYFNILDIDDDSRVADEHEHQRDEVEEGAEDDDEKRWPRMVTGCLLGSEVTR